MRIAIDTRDLKLARTGTKTYLQELLTALKIQQSSKMVILEMDSSLLNANNSSTTLYGKLKQHLFTAIWKQLFLPYLCWQKKADVLICTDYTLPLLPCGAKKIVVFHDALFFDHPEYYPTLWLLYFKITSLAAAHRAAAIVTTSEFSKKRLLYHFPKWEDKLHVILQGPKTLPRTGALSNKGAKLFSLIDNCPYFLHVGAMEKRKNLPLLIKAFAKLLTAYQVKLLLIGASNFKKNSDDRMEVLRLIRELKLESHVLLAGYLPDDDLPFFYAKATAYIYPSIYEGFGIPILEAFHHKLPVIVAKGSSLTEVSGEAALHFDPLNQEELSSAMETLLNHPEIREELIQKGILQKEKFQWNIAANEFVALAWELLFS